MKKTDKEISEYNEVQKSNQHTRHEEENEIERLKKQAKTEIKDLSHPLPLPPFCLKAYGIDDS